MKFTEKDIKNFDEDIKNQLEDQLEIIDNYIRIYQDEINRAKAKLNEDIITEKEFNMVEADMTNKIASMERRRKDRQIEGSLRRIPSDLDEKERIDMSNHFERVVGGLYPDKIFHGTRSFWHIENMAKSGKISIESELGNAMATSTGRLYAGNKDDLERIARSDMALGAIDRPAGICFVIEPSSDKEKKYCDTLGVEDVPLDRVVAIITSEETTKKLRAVFEKNPDFSNWNLPLDHIISFNEAKTTFLNKHIDESQKNGKTLDEILDDEILDEHPFIKAALIMKDLNEDLEEEEEMELD